MVSPGAGERSYHVFYMLLKAATPESRRDLQLGDMRVEDFSYLSSGSLDEVQGWDDAEVYEEMDNALKDLHFAPENCLAMFRLLAGVLSR